MSSKMVILPNKNRIKVFTVPELIANAVYPDGVQVFSNTWITDKGDPLPADEPYQMRFLAKKRIEKRIRDYFDNGKLQLICAIEQAPVLKDYIESTNPFDCLIEFNDFVNFAKIYEVDVVAKENSVDTPVKLAAMIDGAVSQANTELSSTKADLPRQRTRKTNLSLAIEEAIKTFGKKPSLDELWQYFQDDKDTTGFIEDSTDIHIIWRDTKGKFHDTQKETIANHLSRKKAKHHA